MCRLTARLNCLAVEGGREWEWAVIGMLPQVCVSFLLSSSANAYMLMYRRISEKNESEYCVCLSLCVSEK